MGKHIDFPGWVLGREDGLAQGMRDDCGVMTTLTDLTALISCFWVKVLIHLSITV